MWNRAWLVIGFVMATVLPSMAQQETPPSQTGWFFVNRVGGSQGPAYDDRGHRFAWYLFPGGEIRSYNQTSVSGARLAFGPSGDVFRFRYRYWQSTTSTWVYVYQGPANGAVAPVTIRFSERSTTLGFSAYFITEFRQGVFLRQYWLPKVSSAVAPPAPSR